MLYSRLPRVSTLRETAANPLHGDKSNESILVFRRTAGGRHIAFLSRPAKVYSFSPQIFPTGIEVDESVNSAGSGLKHGRLTTHCLVVGGCAEQINWTGTHFLDTNYTVVCSSSDTQTTATPTGKSTSAVFVFLTTTQHIITPIEIDCIAMHD